MEKKYDYSDVIFLADLHFGCHTDSEEWMENISNYFNNFFHPFINKKLEICKNPCVFILGDVYENRKSVNLSTNEKCIEIIASLAKKLPVLTLNGNHDLYKRTNASATSLSSLKYIPNVTIFNKPQSITISDKEFLVIPYLGSKDKETKYLRQHSNAHYALMHTDLIGLSFDNGRAISEGVNSSVFNGTIFSGHIHKRQNREKVYYVGSPYHLKRSDINNIKGVYTLNVESGNIEFTENLYSPMYKTIDMATILRISEVDRNNFFENSYVTVTVTEDNKKFISFVERALGDISVKNIRYDLIREEINTNVEDVNLESISYDHIIESMIDTHPVWDDDMKEKLRKSYGKYLTETVE